MKDFLDHMTFQRGRIPEVETFERMCSTAAAVSRPPGCNMCAYWNRRTTSTGEAPGATFP